MHNEKSNDTINVEATSIFNPNPTGNIFTSGAMIINTGNSSNVIKMIFGRFCRTNTKRLINPKYKGMMKKLAPSRVKATRPQITNHKNKGGTARLAVFSGLYTRL